MVNKPSRPSPRPRRSSATAPANLPAGRPPGRGFPWWWVAAAAAVVIAAVVAVASSGDSEQLSVGTPGTAGSTGAETWPVAVTGTPLEPLPDTGADPAVGRPAPGLSGFGFDGTAVGVDPSSGPVMLVFLAHWCPHCNREVPELLKWQASGSVPADLQVIGVATAVTPARENYPPSEWLAGAGWEWPVLADSPGSEAAQSMGLTSLPFVVIIGTDGNVLTRWAGELGAARIQATVDAALA